MTQTEFASGFTIYQAVKATPRLSGVLPVDHLRRLSKSDYARRVAESNLELCSRNQWHNLVSRCHRVLGDLDADVGQHNRARAHYDAARKIARSISFRPVLIEALLARGRWAARYLRDAASARSDLQEALEYALAGGFRIYEAEIRVALAWAYLTPAPSPEVRRGEQAARVEAERALRVSEEMGYYWGKVDAEEVLKVTGDK